MSSRAAVVLLLGLVLAAPGRGVAADPPAKGAAKPAAKGAAKPAAKPGAKQGAGADQAVTISSGAASPRKLKPGANGEVCLECHADFAQKLAKPSVHTPVRDRDCVGCHNPHASNHGKLLLAETADLCATCHGEVAPKTAKSVHKPAAERRCMDCHDPHAAGFKKNLIRGGNDLCAGCHANIAGAAAKVLHKHKPVEQGCLKCHDPHGSATAPALLITDVPGLCISCHNVDTPIITKKHLGYPVKQARCTTCHDPHGSNGAGLLYETVHPPVAKGMCAMCHEPATSKTPLATRQQGAALCRTCHAQRMAQMLEKNRVHQPVLQGDCLACHSPHAAKQRGLAKANLVVACGACHADTIRRQEFSPTKHKPIAEGNCPACHDPHSSNGPLMFLNADRIELCGTCHDWQKHSTHPIGPSRKDPRNKNLTLECSSCHRAHGTGSKHLIPYAKVTDLCTNCHEKFRR